MTSQDKQIAENLNRVRGRISAACDRAGREVSSVRLVAVTKYAKVDWVRALVEQGVTDLGESRPQQLAERVPQFSSSINWHLIGHLQRNKARRVLPHVCLFHSVDSLRLLGALDRLADELDIKPRILLEVNVAGETQKHGFTAAEVVTAWQQSSNYQQLEIAGLMAMAPHVSNPEHARTTFQDLRKLRDKLQETKSTITLPELSMGMSGDFEVAIEEGATIIRVGSSLYEGLEK